MKPQLFVVVITSLVIMPGINVAQTSRTTRASAAVEPLALPPNAFANNANQADDTIARLFSFQPAIPLGPVDVLKGYEIGMSSIAQRLSADLTSISQAHRANQITRDEAEYLIQERYQVAMMQHEVLTALHESLQFDLDQAAQRPGSVGQSDTAVVQPTLQGRVRTQ